MEIKLSIIAVLLTLDWSGNNGNGCFGRTLTDDATAALMREIDEEFDCNQLKGRLDHNKTEILTICESIVNSDLIRKTKEYMRNLARVRNSEGDAKPFKKMERRLSRKKRAFSSECPEFTKEYLVRNKNLVGRRSLSPYVSELDYDPKRFPKVILDSRCSCSGCIDPATGRETFALSSVPVIVEHSVLYTNTRQNTYSPKTEKFTVACTCVANPILFRGVAK